MKKTYTVTYDELKKYEERGYQRAMERASIYAGLVPMLVLRDRYGFGAKRLEDFFDYMNELIKDIDEGLLDIRDIAKAISDETGLEIRLDKDVR